MATKPTQADAEEANKAAMIPLSFDFTQLGTGFTSPVVTVSHLSGIADADPSAMLLGSATITSDVAVIAIQGGIADADYLVRCSAIKGSLKYVISGVLPVRTAVGRYSQSEILD